MILSARMGFLYHQCPVFVYNEVTKNRTIMHYKITTFIWKTYEHSTRTHWHKDTKTI